MKKSNNIGQQPEEVTQRKKRRKFSKMDKIILGLAVFLLLAAIGFLVWTPIMNYQRNQKTVQLRDNIEQGNVTIIVDVNALSISGEEYETFETEAPGNGPTDLVPTMVPVVLPKDVVLTALGTIKIDKIDSYLPLWDDAGIVPLRYGAGMFAGSALPGTDGNCVVLGHRMKAYGSLFNRLNELSIDDTIVITTIEGTAYTYIVDEIIPKLNPSELVNYIQIDSGSGKQLTLVTCTPTGVGSHRIIVIAHIKA